jgi:DNA-binding CsgD family transcriptional regulator
VLTDLTGMALANTALHYYLGDDMSFFRFPDDALLKEGLMFTKRELESLRMIAQRLESDEIAKKLFLSVNTVNTHRRNILRKSGKNSIHELVIELKEMGLL